MNDPATPWKVVRRYKVVDTNQKPAWFDWEEPQDPETVWAPCVRIENLSEAFKEDLSVGQVTATKDDCLKLWERKPWFGGVMELELHIVMARCILSGKPALQLLDGDGNIVREWVL